MSNYPRGSEWRRWDLHFHTPSSYDVNHSITNEQIVNGWKENNISAVAITDHHEMDIERITNLQELARKENITVFPGIEFLADARGEDPIHFIAIFSENADKEYIWGQIANKTQISKIKGEHKNHNEVYCDLSDTIGLIKELGGIVTIHAGKKSNSLENITHSLPHGDAQKRDIADIVDIFEMGKEKDLQDYRNIVFPAIGKELPMIICSDNHNISNYIFKQKLWIKADLTFEGLKQAINEPVDRFCVADEPDVIKRVNQDQTRYIRSVSISTIQGKEKADQVWFNELTIPFSKELTAIIGNKGSGKSAISDIVSLCADARHQEYFLFLDSKKEKFRKKGFAERFSAHLELESGMRTDERNLDYDIKDTDEPKVQYLPQNYFEKVCNEIGEAESFRDELANVVFQYIPNEEKLNTKSFKELIGIKIAGIEKEILAIKVKINKINIEIIDLEDKVNPSYKNNLISKLKAKKEEVLVHEAIQPALMEIATTENF